MFNRCKQLIPNNNNTNVNNNNSNNNMVSNSFGGSLESSRNGDDTVVSLQCTSPCVPALNGWECMFRMYMLYVFQCVPMNVC